jgi:hypothetical protein
MTSDWTPEFEGQRPPFEAGNSLARKHGVYSALEIGPLQDQILENLTAVAPLNAASDDHALRLLAGRLAQIELATLWVSKNGLLNSKGKLHAIVTELPKWESSARNMMRELGLTTLSRAELGLDIARTQIALSDATVLINEVFATAARFVPKDRREEFIRELDRLQRRLSGDA